MLNINHFSQLNVAGFQIIFFYIYNVVLQLHGFLHCLPSNLLLHSHDLFFVKLFDSFIPVIILKTYIFKSSVLFGTHSLLDKILKALPRPTHLSNLTENG